ncbi:hypothetical protein MY10362_002250 [Beauveria mimosiformis]
MKFLIGYALISASAGVPSSLCLYSMFIKLAPRASIGLHERLTIALMALTLSILALYVKGSTSPNAAGLAFLNLITLGTGFNIVFNAWTAMEISRGAKKTKLPENWHSCGEVVFQYVSDRYKLDVIDQEPAVLMNINLSIEKIGVMGRTGSGKSSLLYSILGFLEYEGTISIDGVDVKTADPDELRSRIITITQELVELDGTVCDNLLPYDRAWGEIKPGRPDAEQQREATAVYRKGSRAQARAGGRGNGQRGYLARPDLHMANGQIEHVDVWDKY